MSRRVWILAATCAALTIGTFSPEQAEAGWRRRCGGGRVHGCAWRGGYGRCGGYAWRGSWGGWGGGWGGGYRGFYGGYRVCSTGYGFGGNYMAGFGSPYGTNYTMPYYANSYSVSPFVPGAYNDMPVVSTPSFYTPSMAARQPITVLPYPGDPVEVSSPVVGFAARYTALIGNSVTSAERLKADTSFLARHSSSLENAVEQGQGISSEATPGYGYSYGSVSVSGYSFNSSNVNAAKDLSNFGLTSVAMDR